MNAHALVLSLLLLPLTSCALSDVSIEEPEDVVVAEIMLRAGAPIQTAVLHRTLNGSIDSAATVPGARIEVTNATGQVLRFNPAPDSVCIVPRTDSKGLVRGSCYASPAQPTYNIVPGQNYSLRITLADGGVMTSTTHVPNDFKILRPTVPTCALPVNDTMTVQWTSSSDAWVYASSGVFRGLRDALAQQGITINDEPLRLFGLSITNQDTTIVMPTEFGLFQRFDSDLTEALIAIQGGLPANIIVDVTIAAADRNYVNWERGGDFNPSGTVRVASIRGNGTGVFGSLVPKTFQIRVASTRFPPC